MLYRISLFLAYVTICAVANTLYSTESFIKVTLGVSKATYFPLESGRFLRNGQIIENPSFSQHKDILEQDQAACSVGGWTAKAYENHETEVLTFTNVQQKLVVFGFRGTEATNGQDWGKNLDMAIVEATIGANSFRIHKGFLARYGFISSWFEHEYSQVPNDYTILITGHSLGGAEATIAAAYAAGKLKRKPHAVITYGSPKVGTGQFKQFYQKMVGCDRTIRMTVRFDPAPSFPVHILWYTHVCRPVEVSGKFTLNLLYKHGLYGGYEDGIERKYANINDINFGCDQKLHT